MDNAEVRDIFNLTYNTFWNRYKGMNGEQLLRVSKMLVEDADRIMVAHDNPLCHGIMRALLDELDRRVMDA